MLASEALPTSCLAQFCFQNGATLEPIVVSEFVFSFYDFDKGSTKRAFGEVRS